MSLKTNGYRIILILTLLAVLAGLCIRGAHDSPWLSLDDCMADPDLYDGRLVTHVTEPMVGEIKANGFYLQTSTQPDVFVYTDTTDLITGEYLGIIGYFHKEGHLTVHTLFKAEHRRYKIIFSAIPAAILIGFFFWRFRWRWRLFQFEGRAHA